MRDFNLHDTQILALDIETNTSGEPFVYPDGTRSAHPPGLDPRVSSITSFAAVDTLGSRAVIDAPGDEEWVLAEIITTLVTLVASGGVLVTWNGTGFDLPFIGHRTGHELVMSEFVEGLDVEPKYGWPEWSGDIATHVGAPYWPTKPGRWGETPSVLSGTGVSEFRRLRHVDLAPIYAPIAAEMGVRHSLKPVYAAVFGEELIEVDRERVTELSTAERFAYVLSDAEGTLRLALHAIDAVEERLARIEAARSGQPSAMAGVVR